jgi:AraC-like DNA-binding protein
VADWRKTTDRPDGPQRGIVDRAASRSVYDLERVAVPSELEPFVEHLWLVSWDLGADVVESAVIPFPSLHLTVEWGDQPERHGHPLPNVLLHGVVTRLFRIQLTGRGGVVGARFRPGGCAAMFGLDVSMLTDTVEPAAAVLPDGLVDDVTRALEVEETRERADRIVQALIEVVVEPTERQMRLAALIDDMREDPELTRVDQLPGRCGWTVRTIQRVFRHDVGVGPKWVLARFRLQEAVLALEQQPGVDLADLAAELGWFDQAHFTNEFRRTIGVTPATYQAAVHR